MSELKRTEMINGSKVPLYALDNLPQACVIQEKARCENLNEVFLDEGCRYCQHCHDLDACECIKNMPSVEFLVDAHIQAELNKNE